MIENEYKFIILQNEYNNLLNELDWQNSWSQKNTYFDTPELSLCSQDITLRVRETSMQISVDTKIKKNNTAKISNLVSKLQLKEIFKDYKDAVEYIQNEMPRLYEYANVSGHQLVLQGFMYTERFEIQKEGYKIHLDHNLYLGHYDFELEIEVINETKFPRELQQLINNLSLKNMEVVGKRTRFFNTLTGRKL